MADNPNVLEEAVTPDVKAADGFTQGYRNTFRVIPAQVVFRPPLPPRRAPLVSQTARVTGPEHEEIYCDEFGRVKCEFRVDRAEFNSERSSCWIRVSSSWAGENFGSVTLPRIGMEVVVRLSWRAIRINRSSPAAWPTRSCPRLIPCPSTRLEPCCAASSSPHTGGYNELMIEDRAGQEKNLPAGRARCRATDPQ